MQLRSSIAKGFESLSRAALEAGAVEYSTSLREMGRNLRGVNSLLRSQGVLEEGLRVTRWARQQRLLVEREKQMYEDNLLTSGERAGHATAYGKIGQRTLGSDGRPI